MAFFIADTFVDSLSHLTAQEQKHVKTTAFDIQMHPENPGLKLHRLENSKDKNFWSARASADLRVILHRSERGDLLCYVDHHDKAYAWAERRKLDVHPKTGAAQLVEIRERIQEVIVPRYVQDEVPVPASPSRKKSFPFARCTDDELLSYGVPVEWLQDVKELDEEAFLHFTDRLPKEASEALLELAAGGKPRLSVPEVKPEDPFEHPDAQRRFRVMNNLDELKAALDAPWDKWTVFLHPDQQLAADRIHNGPAKVSGSAGTGKTIVALHRAVTLAKNNPDSRLLLTTFSAPLAQNLKVKLRRLLGHQPELAERIDVEALQDVGTRLYQSWFGSLNLVSGEKLNRSIQTAAKSLGTDFSLAFLVAEWTNVVDAWQLQKWEEYRDVSRLGRQTRLSEAQRVQIWAVFETIRAEYQPKQWLTVAEMFGNLTQELSANRASPYDFVLVDEAQDLGVSQLRFLAAMGKNRPDALFFAGDLGQQIFQQPFSWKSLGVDIRGRSRTLKVNYRTSHQIRSQADKLRWSEIEDLDENRESTKGTVSVFNGPPPTIQEFDSPDEEGFFVGQWLSERIQEGMAPGEIAVFVRSAVEIRRAEESMISANLLYEIVGNAMNITHNKISILQMHSAKGLEFRAVAVMACDDEIIPSQDRIEAVGDTADLEDTYESERHLLYVALTRARDRLLVTGVKPVSEFIGDLL